MGKNGLADDEAITLQQAVNRCGCRRKVVAVQEHEDIWENVGRPLAPFVLQLGVRWKEIRQLHDQLIVTLEKRTVVHTAYEAGEDPVIFCTLWSREK
jgi:hypothetical protein